jgi:hypothetical protein
MKGLRQSPGVLPSPTEPGRTGDVSRPPMDPDAMPQTITCPQCGAVLNLPDVPPGKRLRCPKCQARFAAGAPGSAAGASTIGIADANVSSTIIRPGILDGDLPTAPGDLREMFDLPMMMGEAEGPAASPPTGAADAAALLREPAPAKRVGAAERRSQARRCPTCGSVVPAGMSLCSRCGLDLETGTRIDFMEDLEPPSLPRRPTGPPLGVAIVGGLAAMAGAILGLVSVWLYAKTKDPSKWGFLLLALLCAFAVHAAVALLRGKTAKLLIAALVLAAPVDVVALIVMPIYRAQVRQALLTDPEQDPEAIPPPAATAGDEEVEQQITPLTRQLDPNTLIWGIALLLIDAGALVYLFSPQVRRYVRR